MKKGFFELVAVKRCCCGLFSLLVALFLFAGVGSAATLVVNCGTVSGPTELAAAAVLCPQFNLAGQTLSNISINVSGGISGSITLTNGDDAAHTGTGTTSTDFSFGGLTGFSFVNPIFSASFTTGVRALNAGQTLTVAGLTSTPISTGTLGGDTTSFAPYTGAGNFTVPVSTSTLFTSAGGGGFFMAAQASSANATAQVTYTYAPTQVAAPEPLSMFLLGTGLVLLFTVHRKRKHQSQE